MEEPHYILLLYPNMTILINTTKSDNIKNELVHLFLSMGNEINVKNVKARVALHTAAQEGYDQVVAALLKLSSDIDIKYNEKNLTLDLKLISTSWIDYYLIPNNYPKSSTYEESCKAIDYHLIKKKVVHLYVGETNEQTINSNAPTVEFQKKCNAEIETMKTEFMCNTDVTIYDILVKRIWLLELYINNLNVVKLFKSDYYTKLFPIYASMIKSGFKKCLERTNLLEECKVFFNVISNNFSPLPYDCSKHILWYLSNNDLRSLINAC